MNRFACVVVVSLASLLIGCSSTPTVNMKEPRRVVGTENDVRVDAEVYADVLSSGGSVPFKYAITNQRNGIIAIADLDPQTSYDSETQTVTVNIGTEIPGTEALPRLILIKPGETKNFATAARMIFINALSPLNREGLPRALRLKLNFLNETQPFVKLIDIPEKSVRDPQLAASLFNTWVDRNETVITGSLPMHWGARAPAEVTSSDQPVNGRRRRVPGTPGGIPSPP